MNSSSKLINHESFMLRGTGVQTGSICLLYCNSLLNAYVSINCSMKPPTPENIYIPLQPEILSKWWAFSASLNSVSTWIVQGGMFLPWSKPCHPIPHAKDIFSFSLLNKLYLIGLLVLRFVVLLHQIPWVLGTYTMNPMAVMSLWMTRKGQTTLNWDLYSQYENRQENKKQGSELNKKNCMIYDFMTRQRNMRV